MYKSRFPIGNKEINYTLNRKLPLQRKKPTGKPEVMANEIGFIHNNNIQPFRYELLWPFEF